MTTGVGKVFMSRWRSTWDPVYGGAFKDPVQEDETVRIEG